MSELLLAVMIGLHFNFDLGIFGPSLKLLGDQSAGIAASALH
jgi:hypothetical protein